MDVSSFELYLFDIEGTTTPIEFVHKTLFPYSVSKFGEFFRKGTLEKTVLDGLIREGKTDSSYSGEVSDSPETLSDYCRYLVSVDRKSGPLKEIQGRIWKEGYESGELKSLMFSDVPSFLERIRNSGKKAAVYSSGSVQAQKLIFEYSKSGDLTGYFSGYFDTAVGGKRESDSYARISRELGISPEKILFFTDIKEEADAATRAGYKVAVLERPGNVEQPEHTYTRLASFETLRP
ncbi:acireductone synthase [Leptospira ellisii]|uniref:Enolase-phosphatase E1 n=1 Tax=Leptospira ellisii TaxID=2023197 RepID=A0A2N0B5Y2_9LEPT|nr:acireductone synthase [Leptospira ellisii]MDV6236783.1 acireductone synthase [Leptospira ellisii]PJZ91957.1 acireductone synthase [Leptospira ellisii]PKA05355.1 acireductone synthase [Leptospira ellisii]